MAATLRIVIVIFITLYSAVSGNDQVKGICNRENWCADCIKARPECAWCNDKDFSQSRCSTLEDLKLCKDILYFDNNGTSAENRSLQDGSGAEEPVQLQPQHMKIKLRVGKPYSFNMKYAVAKNLPIDMYFVLDFTKTMRTRLTGLANLTNDLIRGLETKFTKNIQIGYGSFVDKVLQPFTLTTNYSLADPCRPNKCDPPYGFIHRRHLNKDIKTFSEKIASSDTSSNFDQMEGGLDAVLQAALCPKIIGWRNQSRRIMVYVSDGGFHFAGDGRLAGLDKPNDGHCHLEPYGTSGEYIYTASETQDYPSLAQLATVIDNSNINTYFIVDKKHQKMYEDLSTMSGQLSTNTFKVSGGSYSSEAQDIVDKIIEAYVELTKKITIAADKVPAELEVLVASNCGTGSNSTGTNQTPHWKHGGWSGPTLFATPKGPVSLDAGHIMNCVKVNFNVTITAKTCPEKPSRFVISPQGLQEKLLIEVEYICDCNCTTSTELDDMCTEGNGTYECGVCRCNPQRSGEWCQCDNRDQDQVSYEQMNKIQQDKCKTNNESEIMCSNKGLCNCGQCSCFTNHFGKLCECDKKACQRPGDDLLCSGLGTCTCEGCDCSGGNKGEFCECPPDDCLGEHGICNGRGDCICGICECEDFFNGTYCEECKPQYQSKCETCIECGKDECVKCLENYKESEDAVSTVCRHDCSAINMTKVDKFGKDEQPCSVYDTENCELSYIVKCDDIGSYLLIANSKYCVKDPEALWIALPLLFGIIGVGILMLIIWKILTSFYDKIEYARFEHEIQNPKWSQTENPIYKTATTTNQNPMYHGDVE